MRRAARRGVVLEEDRELCGPRHLPRRRLLPS